VPGGAAQPEGPAGLDAADDLAGAAVVVAAGVGEADQHLVEDDLVEDLDPGGRPQGVGEAAGVGAAALDHGRHPRAAERA
jgi:hypothetical protein